MARKAGRKTPKVRYGYLDYSVPTAVGTFWHRVAVGSPDWFTWLDAPDHRLFSYETNRGSCTVRRETRQRGGEYWAAYKVIDGKTRKRYIGKSETLTPDRLSEVLNGLNKQEVIK
jgi:LuxR family maltose regulon positive regulatory protein